MRAHRIPNPHDGLQQVLEKVFGAACGEAGEAQSEVLERQGEDRDAAAVPGGSYGFWFDPAELRYGPSYELLQRAFRISVAGGIPSGVDAHGEHAGVLARAVAVDGARLLAVAGEAGGREGVPRRVRAVLEVALGEARLAQDRAYRGEVPRLGAVGGAGNRELLAREPEGVSRPREDKWQRLEGLGRRPQVDVTLGVSQGVPFLPLSITKDVTAVMEAFDQVSAPDGSDGRVRREVGGRGPNGAGCGIRPQDLLPGEVGDAHADHRPGA